jgi:hypothetical protein
MRPHFEIRQWLPYPHQAAFASFANTKSLPRLMPHSRARIEPASFVPPRRAHPDAVSMSLQATCSVHKMITG